jgi:hypothetical protein
MKEKEKSICWLGTIPECDEDNMRYPTNEEIEMQLYELENLTEEEYESMSAKERDNFYKKAKKIVKERVKKLYG